MNVKNSVDVTCKKYKLVAPDGGWGYMICLAVIINYSTTTSFAASFGMIFKDYLVELKMSSTNIALMAGMTAVSTAITGFLTSPLLKVLSLRKLAFLAAIISNIGILSVVFIKSQSLFMICQGIMPGAGLGTLFSLSTIILNDYFVTRRVFAISCVQTVVALMAMGIPMFVKWSSETYGSRGTLLLISGMTIHMFLAVIIMQPVEWHMKRIEISNDDQEMQVLLVEPNTAKVLVKLTAIEDEIQKETAEKTEEGDIVDTKKQSVMMRILSCLGDVTLFKTFLVSCPAIGTAVAISADNIYAMMLPQALYSINWSQDDVAWALSLCGFGDLAMRILFMIFGGFLMKLGCQEVYIIGLTLAFTMRLGVQWTHNYIATLFFITIIGASRCIVAIMIPVVIADVVRPDQFTAALGIFFLVVGIINLCVSPAVGAVQDLTKSYATAFYVVLSFYAIIALFWSIELCYKKNKHKHVPRHTAGKAKKANK